jgi:YesN/AraC family two-component response regulator
MDEITVMLVDDEKLFIENLLSIYDWNSNGFNIVSAASNGKQASACLLWME